MSDYTETREEMYADMTRDQYLDWCAAQTPTLDPEADSSRDLYTEALVAQEEADRYAEERWAWENEAQMAYYDDDPSPYGGTYSEM